MKEETVRQIINSNTKKLQKILGLSNWNIIYSYEGIDESEDYNIPSAMCLANQIYRRAHIIINPCVVETKKELLDTLLHELTHCLSAPLASGATYEKILSKHVPARELEILKVLFTDINEEITNNICGVLKRLKV